MNDRAIHELLSGKRVLSHPARLVIMLTLTKHGAISMSELKRMLPLTFGNLERHLHKLEMAGFVMVRKGITWRGLRTVVYPTRDGILATVDHASTLEQLLHSAGEEPARVHEALLVSGDGRLIAHETISDGDMMNRVLLRATLQTIQEIMEKEWTDGDETKVIQSGTRRLLLVRGVGYVLVFAVGPGELDLWKRRGKEFVAFVDKRYSQAIMNGDRNRHLCGQLRLALRRMMCPSGTTGSP
ncbi:MAG: transcriptional regulator [Thermoplasmata archaeon]